MASYNKGSQENINPEQELMNNNNKSSVKSAARQRNTHSTSRPAHISSKPQIKRIQNLDRNTSLSTSISESNFSQYPNGENQFTKRPIIGRELTNVQHIIQSHSNSKTAEVASQHKVLNEHAPSPKRQRLETVDNANNVYTIEERMKEIHYGVQTQPQATVPVTKESIPANLTIHTGPEVPPKLANTPSVHQDAAKQNIRCKVKKMRHQGEVNGHNRTVFNNMGRHSLPIRADSTPSPTIPSKLCRPNVPDSSKSASQIPKNNDGTKELKRPKDKGVSLRDSKKTNMGYPSSDTNNHNGPKINDVHEHLARADSTPSPTIPSYNLPGVPGPSNWETRIPENNKRVLKRSTNLDAQLQEDVQVELNDAGPAQIKSIPHKKRRLMLTSSNQETTTTSNNHNKVKIHANLKPSSGRNETFESSDDCRKFLKAVKRKEQDLKELKRKNRSQSTEQSKDEIKNLEGDIEDCKVIRQKIFEHLASETGNGELHCKANGYECSKVYKYRLSFINHILDNHFEKVAGDASVDDSLPIDSHYTSGSSQITISTPNILQTTLGNLIGSPHSINSEPSLNSSDNNADEDLSDEDPDALSVESTDTETDNEYANDIDVEEIGNRISGSRKPVNLFNSESINLFEKSGKKILNALKRSTSHKISKKDRISENNSTGNTLYDSIYSKEELKEIKHCYDIHKKSDDCKRPCKSCTKKLVDFRLKVCAQSNLAFEEQKKILKNEGLNKNKQRQLLKELHKRDTYSLMRERLESIKKKAGSYNTLPDLVKFRKNNFAILEDAFNDEILQQHIQFDKSNNEKFKFGVFCYKLVDDIVNEFLITVTKECMYLAFESKKIMLTQKLINLYELRFKDSYKDARYYDFIPENISTHFKNKYINFLPKSANFEIMLIYSLLSHSFSLNEMSPHQELSNLILEHLNSPKPTFKFLMYMKFQKQKFFTKMNNLLLRLLFSIAVEVLKLKKNCISYTNIVTYDELISACKMVGGFDTSFITRLEDLYRPYYNNRFQSEYLHQENVDNI